MNDIIFCDLCEEDARELAELDKICLPEAWSQKSFFDDAKNENAKYVIAKHENKIIGYMGMWIAAGEGQITNIAVLPEYRRRHIAFLIMEKMLEFAKQNGISPISLEVRESNKGALALYKKFGFLEVGLRKKYYHNPDEGAILMELS